MFSKFYQHHSPATRGSQSWLTVISCHLHHHIHQRRRDQHRHHRPHHSTFHVCCRPPPMCVTELPWTSTTRTPIHSTSNRASLIPNEDSGFPSPLPGEDVKCRALGTGVRSRRFQDVCLTNNVLCCRLRDFGVWTVWVESSL